MNTLIVIDRAPYGSWAGREGLDMAFSLAAFDQPVSLLFTGAGVHWAKRDQDATAIGQKTVAKNLSAAGLFGVESLQVDATSCERFGLSKEQLIDGSTLVESSQATLKQFEHVVFAN